MAEYIELFPEGVEIDYLIYKHFSRWGRPFALDLVAVLCPAAKNDILGRYARAVRSGPEQLEQVRALAGQCLREARMARDEGTIKRNRSRVKNSYSYLLTEKIVEFITKNPDLPFSAYSIYKTGICSWSKAADLIDEIGLPKEAVSCSCMAPWIPVIVAYRIKLKNWLLDCGFELPSPEDYSYFRQGGGIPENRDKKA